MEEQLQLDKEIEVEVRRDKRKHCMKLAMAGWKGAERLRDGFHTKLAGLRGTSEWLSLMIMSANQVHHGALEGVSIEKIGRRARARP